MKKAEETEMKFKSKYEKGFYDNSVCIEKFLDMKIKKIYYEPITFQINEEDSKLSYTPDFYIKSEDDRIILIEVKPTKKVKDYYYTRARIIAMKISFPEFYWFIALPVKGDVKTWKFERC